MNSKPFLCYTDYCRFCPSYIERLINYYAITSFMNLRNGLIALLAAASISSCSTPPLPNGPGPRPNPDCIVGSAVDYASVRGLDLDVSVYDTNLNRSSYDAVGKECFTRHERDMIDELNAVKNEGADLVTLQKIVNDYPNAGPATVYALRASWNAYLEDKRFDSSLEFYDTNRLGWVALDRAFGSSFPGQIIQVRGHDSLTPYPISSLIYSASTPDWDPNPGQTSSFLDRFPGCEGLIGTGQGYPEFGFQSSADIVFRSEVFSTPLPIRSALPPGSKIENIFVVTEYTFFGDEFSDAYVLVSYDVHPDDNSLIGFRTVYEYMVHVIPGPQYLTSNPATWFFNKDNFDYVPGDILQGNEIVAYVSPGMAAGDRKIYDHTIYVYEERPELVGVGSPFDPSYGIQTLDYLAAHTMPDVPKEFTAVPTQPRYANLSIHGCSYRLE